MKQKHLTNLLSFCTLRKKYFLKSLTCYSVHEPATKLKLTLCHVDPPSCNSFECVEFKGWVSALGSLCWLSCSWAV